MYMHIHIERHVTRPDMDSTRPPTAHSSKPPRAEGNNAVSKEYTTKYASKQDRTEYNGLACSSDKQPDG